MRNAVGTIVGISILMILVMISIQNLPVVVDMTLWIDGIFQSINEFFRNVL